MRGNRICFQVKKPIKAFAFIFLTPGFDPETNSTTTERNGYRFKAVGMDINKKEDVVSVAKTLAQEGY